MPTKYTFEQISQFLAQSNGALGSVGRRFLAKMVFGLIVAESVLLSEITRALGEKISPKQTYKRLDHSLGRYDFEPLADEQARRSCALVTEDHVIALDGGDIAKPCARYLEALARIRDGSKKVITNGYELMSAVAVRPAGVDKNPLPLLLRPYSPAEEGFVSEPYELHKAIEDLHQWTGGRGILVIDRAADSKRVVRKLLGLSHRFGIRLKAGEGSRFLRVADEKVLVSKLVQTVTFLGQATIVRSAEGKRHPYDCRFGSIRVQLDGLQKDGRPLWLCVYLSSKHPEPMALLTTEPADTPEQILFVLQCYLARWSIEEYFRFVKQSYALEKVRYFSWARSKNLIHLVFLVTCLIASLHRLTSRTSVRLRAWLIREAKLVHKRRSRSPLVVFNLYAYAAGLAAICLSARPVLRKLGWFHMPTKPTLPHLPAQLRLPIPG